MNNYKYIFGLLVCFIFMSCNELEFDYPPEDPPLPELVPGTADFSNYVAVGASFSAGVSDGTLFIESQNNSFPNLLAGVFSNAGGGAFSQPMVNDNIGGLLFGGIPIQPSRLYFDGGIFFLDEIPTTEVTNVMPGPYNNMGVPGAKSFELLAPGYGNVAGVPINQANPYYARMASSSGATVIGDAVSQSPTFFTISVMGGNDVLQYATSGGTGEDQTGNLDPSTYDRNDITDPTVFAMSVEAMVSGLTANGAKGVLSNTPYVTDLPYFTSVPYNPVPLDITTAEELNAGFAAYNGGLLQAESFGLITASEREARTIHFMVGNNPVTIVDEDLTDLSGLGLPPYRQTTENDLLVLLSGSFIGTEVDGNPSLINGISVPLTDEWVLTSNEIQAVNTAIDSYSSTIQTAAETYDLAFLDLKAILSEASSSGIAFDDFNLTTDIVFGGLVSLDGIHLTSRGYAYMANKFMEAIDDKYGSNFEASGSLLKAADFNIVYPEGL